MMKIYLIGMPLSGKTTVGLRLAEQLNCKFFDVDLEIEKICGETIFNAIKNNGIRFFRKIESNVLSSTVDFEGNTVISCGGGIVEKKKNRRFLMKKFTLYLECSIETLEQRKSHSHVRPLLINDSSFDILFKRRKEYYNRLSKYVLDGEDNPDDIVNKIVKILNEE